MIQKYNMHIFLLLLIAMWLVSCEKDHKFHQSKTNWKVSSTKGHYPVQHKDTTYINPKYYSYSPILNKKL